MECNYCGKKIYYGAVHDCEPRTISLQRRIAELEAENAKLDYQLAGDLAINEEIAKLNRQVDALCHELDTHRHVFDPPEFSGNWCVCGEYFTHPIHMRLDSEGAETQSDWRKWSEQQAEGGTVRPVRVVHDSREPHDKRQ